MDRHVSETGCTLGCAIFVLLGIVLGTIGLMTWADATYTFNWWKAGLIGVTFLYVQVNNRYVWGTLLPEDPYKPERNLEKGNLVVGRMLCFLFFPCFAYVIALAIWYWMKVSHYAAIGGVVIGWVLTKILQLTFFSQEYVNRDKF